MATLHVKILTYLFITGLLSCTATVSASGKNQPKNTNSVNQKVDEVVITATRLPRNIEDIAGTVSVISEQQIAEQLTTDLTDLVRYQPGISVASSERGGNQGIIIRGIGGVRVLNLIDGIRSVDNYFSNGRDVFEIDDLKSVEIIRGPASALYGADALGGVLLLNTKDPDDYLTEGENTFLGINLAGDLSKNESKLGVTSAIKLGNVGLMAQYTRRDFQEREISADVTLDPLDGQSDNLLTKLVWQINAAHQVKLTIDAFQESNDFQLVSQQSASVFDAQGNDEKDRYRVSLDHQWQLQSLLADNINSKLFWQKTNGTQNTEQRRIGFSFPFAPTGTEVIRVSDFAFNQQVKGADLFLRKSFETGQLKHSLAYGLNYEQIDTERPRNRCETSLTTGQQTCDIRYFPFSGVESFPNKTFPDTKATRVGVYVQNEISFPGSNLTLIPAIRFDQHKLDTDDSLVVDISEFGDPVQPLNEEELSMNLGVIYSLTDQISLFAQYAEGFRPPNYSDANQSFVNRAFGYAVTPNGNLQPENSESLELGIKASLDDLFLSFAVFDNRYDNFIDSGFVESINGISVFQNQNIGEVTISGAEFESHWHITPQWQLKSSIAYAKGENESDDRPLNSVEPLTANIGLSYLAADNKWRVEGKLTLVDSKDRVAEPTDVTNHSYAVLDLLGNYRFSDTINLRLGVFNLFGREYASWSRLQGIDATDIDAINRAHEAGRTWRASLDINF